MMKTFSVRQKERGIALFAVLFAILLLSVIGLGMMYSTNTETAINMNYRDAQTALYAAMAGLQETRDRIQPATLNITPPTGLPSLSAANVVYIINPKNGETVAPWDINNAYADTELCQERILGLTGTVGVPCTTLPVDSAWYATPYDDSQPSAGVWKQNSPLDFKWVRITLKTNNMTPVAASGDSSSSNQVCWDGKNQLLLPNGYGPACTRFGSVIAVNLTNQGSNYHTAPTVTIDAPASGTQATAHANMVLTADQEVHEILVNNQGSGYTSAPAVTLSAPPAGGTQATAHVGSDFVPLNGAPVGTIALGSAGTRCYATSPTIAFTGGGGSGAAAAATLAAANSCIAGLTVTGPCNAHKGDTISGVGLSGGGGAGFSATLTFGGSSGEVNAMTIQNSGTGYTGTPTSFTGFSGCGSLTFTVNSGKVVSAVALTSGGSGYSSAPTVSFQTGVGTTQTQPTATTTLGSPPANAGKVLSIVVDNAGSGYTAGAPAVTFSSGSATATAFLSSVGGVNLYKVASITIDNQGYGYTIDPNVTFDGGGMSTSASATATLGRGANYGKIYTLTAMARTSTGARAMAQMEVAGPVTGFAATGALTIDGPSPSIQNMPNSTQFWLKGNDGNSCGAATPEPDHPAIGGYDDPNASPLTNSVQTITSSLPNPDHYTGDGGTPSVQNVYSSLGETMGTPTGLKGMMDAVNAKKTNDGSTVLLGSELNPQINYISGDVTLSGSNTGYGILAVTGKLIMDGNFGWKGVILVIGDGAFDFGGGGNGQITGTILVAKIWDNHTTQNLLSSMGSPSLNWNGGGGNGIQYDHCWATNMMSKIPIDTPPSTKPLRVLSLRQLP